jgi:hypothetical protein
MHAGRRISRNERAKARHNHTVVLEQKLAHIMRYVNRVFHELCSKIAKSVSLGDLFF